MEPSSASPRSSVATGSTIIAHPELFQAYLIGGLKWPQLRAGSNICLLPRLLSLHKTEQDQFLVSRLSPEQIGIADKAMRESHARAGITIPPHLPEALLQTEWYKSRSAAAHSLQLITNRYQSDPAQALTIAEAGRRTLLSETELSKLFIFSFYPDHRRELAVIHQELGEYKRMCEKVGLDPCLLDVPSNLRIAAQRKLANLIMAAIKVDHGEQDLTWLLADLLI